MPFLTWSRLPGAPTGRICAASTSRNCSRVTAQRFPWLGVPPCFKFSLDTQFSFSYNRAPCHASRQPNPPRFCPLPPSPADTDHRPPITALHFPPGLRPPPPNMATYNAGWEGHFTTAVESAARRRPAKLRSAQASFYHAVTAIRRRGTPPTLRRVPRPPSHSGSRRSLRSQVTQNPSFARSLRSYDSRKSLCIIRLRQNRRKGYPGLAHGCQQFKLPCLRTTKGGHPSANLKRTDREVCPTRRRETDF